MSSEIANPHDKLVKQLLGEPENAASFLAANLPADLVAHLDLNTLAVVQASFIDAQFTQSEADLLFSVMVANRPGYVYLLIEHQSSPDGFMMLRLLSYMVRVWKRFQRETPGCERLPVVLPMVVFHGSRGWQGPVTFEDLVDVPDTTFLPYTPAFHCKLFDLSPFGRGMLAGNALVRVLGDLLGAYGLSETEGQGKLRSAFATLNELLQAPAFAQYLEIVFRYALQIGDIPKEQLGRMVIEAINKHDVEEFLMTTYEQLKQEGRVEGEKVGLQKGASRVLLRQLSKRFPQGTDRLLPLLQDLTPEQHDELSEKILDAVSFEEIHAWLKSIRGN